MCFLLSLSLQYVFLTEVDSSTQLSTHDELARLMLHFLLERERDDALRVVKVSSHCMVCE